MKKHYDFSNAMPNPYAEGLKQPITIRLDPFVIEYFKQMAPQVGLPYQTLINVCLRQCSIRGWKLTTPWHATTLGSNTVDTHGGRTAMVREGPARTKAASARAEKPKKATAKKKPGK